MNNLSILVVTLLGWLLGQAVIFTNHFSAGAAVLIAFLLFGFIFYFRVWEHINTPGGIKILGMNAPVIFTVFSVASAITAAALVVNSPKEALMLFILSGLMLFMARPVNEKLFDFAEISEKPAPVEKWEPFFMAALALISFGFRLYDLANLPPVAHGGEGLVIGNCAFLDAKGAGYTPHIGGGTDWPTFTYYVGIFFAKIFGWEVGSFRIGSGLVGALSVISFYFLTRRLTSPFSAAITSLMYTVFIPHLTMSRQFDPLPLLFLPHIICLGFLLAAAKNSKWYLYLAAGLGGGFSLQGYVPGRGVFVLFLAWFALLFITRKKIFHKPVNFLIFWAGFLLTSLPVVYYAIRYPQMYWGYVQSVDPSRTGGIASYLKLLISTIPMYTEMFYTKSAWDVLFHLPYKPLFDPVTSVMFSAGIFLCLFAFWKPVPAILLILFAGGMVPGLLGGGSSIPPNTQRTLLTFPVIFIFCAMAFERLKRVYYAYGNKLAYGTVLFAAIAASLWSFQEGYKEYFVRFVNDPSVKINAGYHLYEMGRKLKQYPQAEAYTTPFFMGNDTFVAFAPPGRRITAQKHLDDMLVLKPDRDSLLMMEPFYTNTLDFFKACFPNAVTETIRESKENEKNFYYTKMRLYTNGRRHIDEFVPFVFFNSVYIPKKDVEDFQNSLFGPGTKPDERVRVFGKSGFAGNYAGKRVVLRGAVLVPETGALDSNITDPLVISLGWNSWKLVFDGRERQLGRPFKTDSGIHYFELSGIVPAGSDGDLPLTVTQGTRNYHKEGRVVAAKGPVGVRTFHTPGFKNWQSPYTYSRRLIEPNFRMYDGLFMSLPFSIRQEAMLKVPVTGEYEFKANENSCFKITVNGRTVVDNLLDQSIIKREKIFITAEKPVKFELLMSVLNSPIYLRALTVFVKGPGMNDFEMVPVEWFTPVN